MNDFETLHPDLIRKSFPKEIPEDRIIQRKKPPLYTGPAIYLDRSLQGRSIDVGTSPVLLVRETQARPYLILNPSKLISLTDYVIGKASSTETTAGTSQDSYMNVAGFIEAHFFVNVSSILGTWDIWLRSYDPISGLWVDVTKIIDGISSPDIRYVPGGSIGIASRIAFKWIPVEMLAMGIPSITFSVAVTLKQGVGGDASGLDKFVFLGGPEVTINSGYPLVEGQREIFIIGENVELWAITANINIDVRIFQL